MITKQEHTGFKRVENYGFAEWLKEVQEVIQDGYEFDFESNDNYPLQIGTVYTAVMKPKETKELKVPLSGTVQNAVQDNKLNITIDTTEIKNLIDEKINEVKELQALSESATVTPKVDGRKKK